MDFPFAQRYDNLPNIAPRIFYRAAGITYTIRVAGSYVHSEKHATP